MTHARRIVAARYLRLLASAENLAVLHLDDELRRALDAVDPIEARELANELDGREAQVIPFGNPTVLDAWRETYPQVVHAGDNWSKKAGA